MSLTREQFYNKAIRPNLARFSSTVKVRDILPHLTCLTLTDREEIEAKRDNSGNFTAMQTLLDNLRRRENWPEEFITALRNCEHSELAAEMSTAFDKIRGITNNTAASAAPVPKPAPTPAPSYSSAGAPATVIQATIHTVPETTSLLIPSAGNVPAHSTAPSNMAAPEPSPAPVLKVPETQQVQKLPTPVPAPSLEPASQAEIAPSQAPPPAVVSKVPTPGPAENKTPVLDTPDGLALTNQTTTSSTGETPLSTLSAQPSSSNTSQIQITQPCTTLLDLSSQIQLPITVKDTSNSEKVPVQDTSPPMREERTIQGPKKISDPSANELVQRNNTVGLPVFNGQTNSTRTDQATSSAPSEVVTHPPSSISEEYFSKPSILRSELLLPEDPCSVVSDDLQFSRATECTTESNPAEQTSTPISSLDSASRPFNDPPHIPPSLTPNQPEEDYYESLYENQTLTRVIQFAEEAPVENLNGQPPSMLQRSSVISEDQHTLNQIGLENVVPLSDPSGHGSQKSATINYQEKESNARPATILQPEQREESRPELFMNNNFQLIAAVAATGIAVSVFLAWKLKH